MCPNTRPKFRWSVESVRSRCQRDIGSSSASVLAIPRAIFRFPSPFSKSIGFNPKEGYVNPIVIEPMENVFLNAVGLPNPGYKKFIENIQEFNIDFSKTPLIISVWGGNEEEFNTIVGNFQDINVKIFELIILLFELP